jgi:hypothetical protein
MAKVIEFGPNVNFADGATFHIHAVDCHHILREPYRSIAPNSDQGGYTYDYDSIADAVEAIYPADDFDYDPETDHSYRNDISVFPCTGLV